VSGFIKCWGVRANENKPLEKKDKKEDQRDAKPRRGSSVLSHGSFVYYGSESFSRTPIGVFLEEKRGFLKTWTV
jgi:hypothetical protein